MTKEELQRVQVMDELVQEHIKQGQAAQTLGLSVRQVKRLKRIYQRDGAKALISKKRGHPSNHQLKEPVEQQTLRLLRQHYADFGPTHACHVSVEYRSHHRELTASQGTGRTRQPNLPPRFRPN